MLIVIRMNDSRALVHVVLPSATLVKMMQIMIDAGDDEDVYERC